MSADPTPADVYEAAALEYERAMTDVPRWVDAFRAAVDLAYAAGRAAATPDGGTWQWGVRSQRGGETIVAWYRDERAARYFHSLGEGDPSHALIRRQVGPVEPVPAPDATETGRG